MRSMSRYMRPVRGSEGFHLDKVSNATLKVLRTKTYIYI